MRSWLRPQAISIGTTSWQGTMLLQWHMIVPFMWHLLRHRVVCDYLDTDLEVACHIVMFCAGAMTFASTGLCSNGSSRDQAAGTARCEPESPV